MYTERNYFTWIKTALDCVIIANLLNEETIRDPSPKCWKDQYSDFAVEMWNLGEGGFGIVWSVSYLRQLTLTK